VLHLVLWAFHNCNSLTDWFLRKIRMAHLARDDERGSIGRSPPQSRGPSARRSTSRHLHPLLYRPPLLPSQLVAQCPISSSLKPQHHNHVTLLSKSLPAHWHKGAILIWGALHAPQIPDATAGFVCHDCEVVTGVDDFAAITWSINYYNDTAHQASRAGLDRRRANGGLGEYYSEGDTRAPTWLIAGDAARTCALVGLDGRAAEGGAADPDVAARWLDDGIVPNGAAGRAFSKGSVHGFDLTFAAPKSVSLLRALTDDIAEKKMQAAHQRAISAAMTYLHQHAGYTRVHNPVTGAKDLQRLPGLVAIAYQHETSRCGDPHLHTHVIVPNRQARADGTLVSIDSKSLFHEAKAAGIVYQAPLRHELHAELGVEWTAVDPFTGMAEIAAVTKKSVTAWSQRSTRAGLGAQQSGDRRWRAERAAARGRAESNAAR
jgi:conjugative relaxase-like TrwC/TraI family protein